MTTDVQELIAERDIVVGRYVWRGRHTGEIAGVPATGRAVAVDGCDFVRIRDGRIVEVRGFSDTLGLYAQLGATPPVG